MIIHLVYFATPFQTSIQRWVNNHDIYRCMGEYRSLSTHNATFKLATNTAQEILANSCFYQSFKDNFTIVDEIEGCGALIFLLPGQFLRFAIIKLTRHSC